VVFDQNTLAGEWREQVRCCEAQDIALHRNIAFALAIANVLELLPLMPAVRAPLSVPICLSNPGSLAYLKAVARSACSRGDGSRPIRKGSLLTGI
jgi:hypothetical protein